MQAEARILRSSTLYNAWFSSHAVCIDTLYIIDTDMDVREGRFRPHSKTAVFNNNGRRGGLPPMWWSVRVTFGPGRVYPPQSYGGGGLPPVVVVMPPPGLPPAAVIAHSATVGAAVFNCGTLPCRGMALL